MKVLGASSIPFIVTPIFMLVYIVAFVDLAIQHDDVSQPANLFVNSFIGNDNGNNCQNSTFPCQTISHAIKQAGESDVIALNGKFVLNDTITLSRNITLTTWFWSNPPLLVGIKVLGSSNLINLRISGCSETGTSPAHHHYPLLNIPLISFRLLSLRLVIYLQNSNQMRASFDRLEIFGNAQGLKAVQSGSFNPVFNPINFTNCVIRNNDNNGQPLNGCGVALISSVAVLENSRVIDNNCRMGLGGGIYLGSSSFLSVKSSIISHNLGSKGGGYTCVIATLSDLGIYSEMARMNIVSSEITLNTATDGGGLSLTSTQTLLENSKVNNNKVSNNGGGIWAEMGWTNLSLTSIVNNNAVLNGGGFYGYQAGTYTLDTLWNNNIAGANGGGLYTIDCTVMMNQMILSNNKAYSKGGGGYLRGSSNMFWNVTAIRNEADDGGAMYLPGSTVVIWNSTLEENKANISGGAFACDTATLIIYNATLLNNISPIGRSGPGAFLQGSTMVVTNVTIDSNLAGGARQDIVCVDSSPNIYEADGVSLSIPIIICLRQCDALLVFANGTQTHPCHTS